jgi:YbbR domain-containing protein
VWNRLHPLVTLFTRNKGLKALSLLMAVISWYLIQDAISFEVDIPDIRLQVQAREGMAILNQSAATVDVTFRGSQDDLQRLDPRQIQAVLYLPPTSEAAPQDIPITPEAIKGARGVRAIAIDPPKVRVTLDLESDKRVPVKGRTTGQPLFGQVEAVTCEPATVLLRGPAARLRTTDCVYTQPVDTDGRVESFVRRCAVLPPGDSWTAQLEPGEVEVHVTIAGRSTGREWKQVPVTAMVAPGRSLYVELDPPRVDVVASGRASDLETIDIGAIRVFADCVGLNGPGTCTLPVHVFLPTGRNVTAVTRPDAVRVTVELR